MPKEDPYKEFMDELIKDPARLKKFMRCVMGPPRRTLEGKEREQVLLLLAMMEPFESSNNQISWTDCYMIGDKEYHRNIDVIKLEVKEHKINLNGEWVTIDKIELKPYNGLVYNITVEDTHNYIVENVLVHNMPVKKEFS
jgi:intein/homing endonuclease